MNGFCVAVLLGITVSQGFVTSQTREKSCEFPHKGNGGVLDQNQGYINDSALVWVDVAENCIPLVTSQEGINGLNSWIDASQTFNIAMKNGDIDQSFQMLYKINDSFKTVAPFLSKPEVSEYFMKVYNEFGALLKTGNLKEINEYLIGAYPQIKEKLGC